MKNVINISYTTTNKKSKEFPINKNIHKSSLFSYLTLFIFIKFQRYKPISRNQYNNKWKWNTTNNSL